MKSLLQRLCVYAEKVAACVDIEDDLRLDEACVTLLSSVPVKRRSEVENELIAVAQGDDAAHRSTGERERLIRRGFVELVSRAAERRRNEMNETANQP